ncbi:MAG: imidazolonepropionase [Acidobacteriia bacterium]|nr:imidazolonepropionase [Terriglobia bacterium]
MTPSPPRALFLHSAAQLLTLAGPPVPRRGPALGELGIMRDGAVLTWRDKILRVGRTRELAGEARRLRARLVDCRGRVVMPGFIDSHTHLVFAGNRVEDFERRICGATYEEIARAGGGIARSARLVAEATEHELVAQARRVLDEFAAHGTTTVEVKTGYGLDVANEMKILRVIRKLQRTALLELVPTLLAAHALPAKYRGRPQAYLRLITQQLIPQVGRKKLARFIDCFCDRGAFTVSQCRQVLAAGLRYGLIPRIHAEQLARTGACRLAVELGAASADHLDQSSDADVQTLAQSDVVATLLPAANFHLGLRQYAPARKLIEAGAAVALATDFNPGTSPTLNMQFILSLACSQMRMTPAEAVSAATINAAYSLRCANRLGSLEPGKQADLVVMAVCDHREIPYYLAWNHCAMTVKRGRIIHSQA